MYFLHVHARIRGGRCTCMCVDLLPSYAGHNLMESIFPSVHLNDSNTIDDFIHSQYSLISQFGCIQSEGKEKVSSTTTMVYTIHVLYKIMNSNNISTTT